MSGVSNEGGMLLAGAAALPGVLECDDYHRARMGGKPAPDRTTGTHHHELSDVPRGAVSMVDGSAEMSDVLGQHRREPDTRLLGWKCDRRGSNLRVSTSTTAVEDFSDPINRG